MLLGTSRCLYLWQWFLKIPFCFHCVADMRAITSEALKTTYQSTDCLPMLAQHAIKGNLLAGWHLNWPEGARECVLHCMGFGCYVNCAICYVCCSIISHPMPYWQVLQILQIVWDLGCVILKTSLKQWIRMFICGRNTFYFALIGPFAVDWA